MEKVWLLGFALFVASCGAGGPSPDATCNRYLACVSKVEPNGYPAALTAYGRGSSCWSTPQGTAQCEQACSGSLASLVESCGCAADADCAQTVGAPIQEPYCDTVLGRCVACTQSSQCLSGQVCDRSSEKCVECSTDSDCPSTAPLCRNNACAECDDTHACPAAGQCNMSLGVCTSPCDSVLYCTETAPTATWGACLSDDGCCPMEASCGSLQPLRSCLMAHCGGDAVNVVGTSGLYECAQTSCAAELQACHTGGC